MKKTEFQKIISRQIKFESRWHICFDVFNIFVACNPNLFWNYELKNQVVDVQAIPDEGEDESLFPSPHGKGNEWPPAEPEDEKK